MKRREAKKRALVHDLVSRLNDCGARGVYDARTSTLTIRGWESTDLDPPVRLHVDDRTLRQHLRQRGMRSSGKRIWPDVDRATGAIRLLTIHIEETVLTRKPGQTDLVLDPVTGQPEWVAYQGIGPSSRK